MKILFLPYKIWRPKIPNMLQTMIIIRKTFERPLIDCIKAVIMILVFLYRFRNLNGLKTLRSLNNFKKEMFKLDER
jgi:hypothetical protein